MGPTNLLYAAALGASITTLCFGATQGPLVPPVSGGPAPAAQDAAPEAGALGEGWRAFLAEARASADPLRARAAHFLAEHAPARDAGLSVELLRENLALALEARARFPWAAGVPEDVFLNDVLPYASLDETREAWRPKLLEVAAPLVADARTLEEAAQALNRGLFNAVNVHYNTGRKQPNQSPAESIAQTRATCTGLSILLVDACRAVGVPARIAGVASWADKRGNHTWVEVFDGADWRFTGADEYDAAGLDRGWFVGDASKAVAGNARFGVWATSWRATGAHFPMVWGQSDRSVPAVDVTARYARTASDADAALALFSVRVWREPGARVAAEVVVRGADGAEVARETTRAGRADLNDMPALRLAAGEYTLEVTVGGETRRAPLDARTAGARTLDLNWSELTPGAGASPVSAATAGPAQGAGLSRAEAEQQIAEAFAARTEATSAALAAEYEAKAFVVGERTLRTLEKRFGDAAPGERSLWISMHGGGGAPREVNDRQWANQIRLYEPSEGFYVAPRAPTDTWNLWHEGHIDPLFQRLIDAYVTLHGVDPDRVYLM
ncbi:MAG: transglutaminase domain-containing protein, partial [Planctomycetota bacterium]